MAVVNVLVVTDLHGQLLPYDYVEDKPFEGGLTRVATLLKELRQKGPTLFFDNGDAFQGSALSFYAQRFSEGKANPIVDAYNNLQLDGMVVGNHEFNYGLKFLKQVQDSARFPLMSANIVDESTGSPTWLPFKVYRFGPIKVGVIALTTPAVEDFDLPWKWKGLRFVDPLKTAQSLVAHLRDQGVEVIIALVHSGLEYDPIRHRRVSESLKENFVFSLADKVKGIDVIVFGHTHRAYGPVSVKGTKIVQPASQGRGAVLIQVSDQKSIKVENLDLSCISDDQEMLYNYWPIHRKTRDWMNEVIGIASEPLVSDTWKLAANPVSNLYVEVLQYATDNEICLHPESPFEPVVINKGWITRKDSFRLYPFDNEPIVLRISGKTLLDALEWNSRFYYMLKVSPWRIKPIRHPLVKTYNFEAVGGLEVVYDLTAPVGKRVKKAKYMGGRIHRHQYYWVSLTSYRASGAGEFTMFKNQHIEYYSPQLLRDYFEKYVTEKGTIDPRRERNWYFAAGPFTLF